MEEYALVHHLDGYLGLKINGEEVFKAHIDEIDNLFYQYGVIYSESNAINMMCLLYSAVDY